ncbi:MAG: TfoX/Sxy family protein [Eubacteriales bacterium]
MAAKSETADILLFLTAPAGVTAKEMFGEYALYCGGKVFALVCDDALFVKITPSSEKLLFGAEKRPPYSRAKEMFAVKRATARFCANLRGRFRRKSGKKRKERKKWIKKRFTR